MRTLLLLRGCPGSGKSTFIKMNNLEQYTLEADKFRMLVSNPVLNLDGEFSISQKNDSIAWDMLLNCLEERMKGGHFTVIDATHSSSKLIRKYKNLAEQYKYSIYYIQLETPLEQCLLNNRNRPAYKFVPEEYIKRSHALVEETDLSCFVKRIYSLSEIDNFYIEDVTNLYDNVKVIGDIHGCYSALNELIDSELKEDTLYVFCGDYLDRGIENKKVLDFLIKIKDLPNVRLLEGNHDRHIKEFGWEEKITSSKFKKVTLPEITVDCKDLELLKKNCRRLYKKLRQAYLFRFGENKFIVTHGGLPCVPKLAYVSANEMIKGIGGYESEIGEIYDENYLSGKCQNFIQIHGHRGVENGKYSYCLEGEVEFGGYLKYMDINKNGFEQKSIKNEVFNEKYLEEEIHYIKELNPKELTQNEEVNKLIISHLIKKVNVGKDLIALNFKRTAFKKKLWNKSTIKARGLFVDKVTGEVKIRSYDKFFNYGELYETRDKNLKKNLRFPVKAIKKYNGFLGILSVVNDELVLSTKGSLDGDFVKIFKNIFYAEDESIHRKFYELSKNNNCSFVFEVISTQDKHIVSYEKDELILLDAIKNEYHINGVHVDESFSNKIISQLDLVNAKAIRNKECEAILEDFDSIEAFMKDKRYVENIEGYVFLDRNGFMFKYKNEWYQTWKRIRSLVGVFLKNRPNKFQYYMCKNQTEVSFMKWLEENQSRVIDEKEFKTSNNIVDLRKKYFKEKEK